MDDLIKYAELLWTLNIIIISCIVFCRAMSKVWIQCVLLFPYNAPNFEKVPMRFKVKRITLSTHDSYHMDIDFTGMHQKFKDIIIYNFHQNSGRVTKFILCITWYSWIMHYSTLFYCLRRLTEVGSNFFKKKLTCKKN